MIDARDGTILLAGQSGRLGPALTVSAFHASELGRAAKLAVHNEPWRTFALRGLAIGGARFGALLSFEGERLDMVVLCLEDSGDTLSYEAIDAQHQSWLGANLRSDVPWRPSHEPRRFVWGSLWAGFDVKSGGPEIVVAYGR